MSVAVVQGLLTLVGVGIPTSALLGVFNPNGIETGHQSEEFYDAVIAQDRDEVYRRTLGFIEQRARARSGV